MKPGIPLNNKNKPKNKQHKTKELNQSLLKKLLTQSITYKEAKEVADFFKYEIIWKKKKD